MLGSFILRFSRDWKIRLARAIVFLAATASLASGADFIVALNGDDAWSGTKPEPAADRADGPFRTVHRAAQAVRGQKAEQPDRRTPIIVQIREGTYFLERPLVLGPEDSGTTEVPGGPSGWSRATRPAGASH